jgi:protocatechuate 3,4-dioxygenase, alpha subunit
MTRLPTPSQTVGPFFTIGLRSLGREQPPSAEIAGEEIFVTGRIVDGNGDGVNDALMELWHADVLDKCGRLAEGAAEDVDGGCAGFLRVRSDENGGFAFKTIKPGRVTGIGGALQAPHIVVVLFMRGLLKQLVTRVYFPDGPGNTEDAILALVPEARRASLLLKKVASRENHYKWNVVLQGADETVFFDF